MKSSAKMMQTVVKTRKMIILVMTTRAGVDYNEESDADEENDDSGD